MDGVGVRESDFGNAYLLARTPHLDRLKTMGLYQEINAHGTFVGLPSDSDIGNSEVGHNAIGAGQIYDQGAKLVQNAVADGSMFQGDTWKTLTKQVKDGGKTLHLIGLLSDGNVHSHIDHLKALIAHAKTDGVSQVRLHLLLDGRDVGEKSCEKYIEDLKAHIVQLNDDHFQTLVASGGGRMTTTMDRYEADWSMVEKGWKAHVLGEGDHEFSSIDEMVKTFRDDPKLTDQFFPSFVICDSEGPVGKIQDGDAVIFFNFRGDRAIEISRAFTEQDFSAFDRKSFPKVFYAGMMEYDGDLHIPQNYLVTPPSISHTLGEHLAHLGVQQFACSETQKYGHVTYFWNGNRSGMFDKKLESYVEVPSDNVPFELRPWMKADEICNETMKQMASDKFQFGRINFANGDMVGHTGDLEASIVAVSTVDMMIGRLIQEAEKHNVVLVITADHGNCDEMFDAKEVDHPGWKDQPWSNAIKPKTSHTRNKVPFYIYDPEKKTDFSWVDVENPGLGNIAGTVCDIMGLDKDKQFLPSMLKVK